mmetsp:Transcript_27031/g.57267  ORF Transcript_27031/g.57267 Transcript_27031/m.57267 type:complete len:192 (-) Transcript_27031:73-648(-)
MDVDSLALNLQVGDGPQEERFDHAAKGIIKRALREAPLFAPDGSRLEFDSVNIDGEAILHFRKGKRIPCFDYRISCPMRVRLSTMELATWQMEVPEFTNSYGEVPEDMEVRIPGVLDWHCQAETAKELLVALRQDSIPAIRTALLRASSAIVEAGMSPPPLQKKGPPDLQAMLEKARLEREGGAGGPAGTG